MALRPIDPELDPSEQAGAVMEFKNNPVIVGKNKSGNGFKITITFSSRKIADIEGELDDAKWCRPTDSEDGNEIIDEEFRYIFDVIDGTSKWVGPTTYYFEITDEDFSNKSKRLDEDTIIDRIVNFDDSNFSEFNDDWWTPSVADFFYESPYLKQ